MSESLEHRRIYNYSPHSGEYLDNAIADIDPRDSDNVLVPAHATLTAPPAAEAKPGHVFAYRQDVWVELPDNRGQSYYLPDGTYHEINEIGEGKPPQALKQAPDLRSLAEAQAEAYEQIAEAVEVARETQLQTASPLQIACYQLKAGWAQRLLANADDKQAQSLLQSEASARKITPQELAALVWQKFNAMENFAILSETLRITARTAIAQASNNHDVDNQAQAWLKKIAALNNPASAAPMLPQEQEQEDV